MGRNEHSTERIVSCGRCGAVLAVYEAGERVPDPPHECPCIACDGAGWVWEYDGHGEPVKAPCHRCGGRIEAPSAAEMEAMAR